MPDDISSFTKTYSTANYTIPNATAVAVATTGATASSPYGYSEAQANAIVTNLNALVADVLALKKVIVAVVNEMENDGMVH